MVLEVQTKRGKEDLSTSNHVAASCEASVNELIE